MCTGLWVDWLRIIMLGKAVYPALTPNSPEASEVWLYMTLLEGSGSHLEPSARESTTAATVSSMPSTHGVVIRDLHYQERPG